MIRRAIVVLAILMMSAHADAHVGSPDVFYEGDAGPYHLFITVRMPQVIPGIADIEIHAGDGDVASLTVVPLRLSGPGSELPPVPDRAERSTADPQVFTASLWLMESGALQVRVAVSGARGEGQLSLPLAASAQRTLGMNRTLGGVLFALMLLLGVALVSITAAAIREATLDPGVPPAASARRRTRIVAALASGVVLCLLAAGGMWWRAEALQYEAFVAKPWRLDPVVQGCRVVLPGIEAELLPDHGHDIHLFVVRTPELDRLAHLHPVRQADGSYAVSLPSLPAGKYALFVDIVVAGGYPVTGTAEIELPALSCAPLTGDDSALLSPPSPSIVFDRPPLFRAGVPQPLRFHVVDESGAPATDVEPYMAMAGHAVVIRSDLSVFAHLHPSGTVAMPALMLAGAPHAMFAAGTHLPPVVAFPYAFPRPGRYEVFVQLRRAGQVVTGAFDVDVVP